MTGRAAVFLDRDGVLNRAIVQKGRPHPPASVEELDILPGVATAAARLRDAGFLLVMLTDEADRPEAAELNATLAAEVPLHGVLTCTHGDGAADCACRPPEPGLLLAGADRYGVDLAASFVVGDRWHDVEAGRRAGCRTVFVDHDYDDEPRPTGADLEVGDLPAAVDWLLGAQPVLRAKLA